MRKLLLAALAAAVAVAGFAVIAQAGTGEAGTRGSSRPSRTRSARPPRSNSLIVPAKVDDQGTADTRTTSTRRRRSRRSYFPQGQRRRHRGAQALQADRRATSARGEECPSNTRLGDGDAVSVVGGTPVGTDGKRRAARGERRRSRPSTRRARSCSSCSHAVRAPARRRARTAQPAGGPIVLQGKWSKVTTKPTLAVPTPSGPARDRRHHHPLPAGRRTSTPRRRR